ncbi:MAG: TonB-dependent receptor [Bacteroidetes bacterium]|uniref:TonB-dependent receptor n=1 Tax=Candidatus Cryptobacteroides intestinavium TaxID=2840766 RepID=A0A9D9HI05_9BACT|nr:TonB-dependent receptor [Candidatus Cryptobacteroides intestinavium]
MRLKIFIMCFILSLVSLCAFAQDSGRTITGTVQDAKGNPLVGAVVMQPGSSNGAVTDADGAFSIEVSGGGTVTLEVSILGYVTKSFSLPEKQDVLKAFLSEDALLMDEAVVVGYGTQKKVNLTGAISTVEASELANRATSTLGHMLQGSVPGLNVTMSSGRPGNSPSVNIRGMNSINGGSPLILIDGVEGSLDRVNPNDVESISVIKDASSSAVYGARASFGVILVTTKTGNNTDGKAKLSYSGKFGFTAPTTSTDYETRGYYSVYVNDLFMYNFNGSKYSHYTDADMEQLWARRNDKVEDPSRPWVIIDQRNGRDEYVYYANTDWYHYLFQDIKPTQTHNISFSGGNDRVKYYVSGSYYDEEGQFRENTDKFTRIDFRSKISFDVTDWLNVSNNTSYFKSWYSYPGSSGVDTAFSLMTVHALASYPTRNPDGSSLYITSGSSSGNVMDGMLTALDKGLHKNNDDRDQISTTTEVTVTPFKGLEIKGNFTYTFYDYRAYNRFVNTTYSTYPGVIEELTTGSRFTDKLQEISNTHTFMQTNVYATYSKTFAEKHNLKVMAGFNWETKRLKDIRSEGYYLLSETLNDLNLVGVDAEGNKRMEVSGGQNEYAIAGVFARVNYDYMGKYLFEASGRYDGTSRFARASRWGFFPSASVGWKISEENFFSPVKDWFNYLKLRYSFGRLGNQQVGYYDYIREVNISDQTYLFGGSSLPIVANISAPVAGDLTWEVAQHQNVGVDMAFFNNRLAFTAEAYIRDTKDMLTDGIALPSVYGASSPKMNTADLRTSGYELSLSWKDMFMLAGRPFQYNVGFNFSDYTTVITKYDNPEYSFAMDYYEGMRVGEIWGYRTGGLFASDAEAAAYDVDQSSVNGGQKDGPLGGDLKFLDLDGNKIISIGSNSVDDPGDREIIGNSEPRFNYGINLGFSWCNFDVSIFIQGIGRMDWYPPSNCMAFWGPYARPYASLIPKDFHTMYWTEDNPDAYYPRPRGYIALGDNRALTVANDRYLQNIGYCRLKNVTIGYSLPQKWMKKIKADGIRIYFTGENLAYLSGLKSDYIDPELAMTGGELRVYPWQKTFIFGIDINF